MRLYALTLTALALGAGQASAEVTVRCAAETFGAYVIDHSTALEASPEKLKASVAIVGPDKSMVEVFTGSDCSVEVDGEIVETGISRAKAFIKHRYDAETSADGLAHKILPVQQLTDSAILPEILPSLFRQVETAGSVAKPLEKQVALRGGLDTLEHVVTHIPFMEDPVSPAKAEWILYTASDLIWMTCTENVKFMVPPGPDTKGAVSATGAYAFLDGAVSVAGGVFETECMYRSIQP